MTSLADVFAKLDALAKSAPTEVQIKSLVSELSIVSNGSTTIFYGGKIDGVKTSDIISAMVSAGNDMRVIDKSDAGRFLKSPDLLTVRCID